MKTKTLKKTKPRLGDLPAPGMGTGAKLLIGVGILGLGYFFKDKIKDALLPPPGRGQWVNIGLPGVEARIDGVSRSLVSSGMIVSVTFRNGSGQTAMIGNGQFSMGIDGSDSWSYWPERIQLAAGNSLTLASPPLQAPPGRYTVFFGERKREGGYAFLTTSKT